MDIATILGAGAVVAVIEAIKELLLWSKNRKAQLEDKKSDKADEQEKDHNAYIEALRNLSDKMEEYIKVSDQHLARTVQLLDEIKADVSRLQEQQEKQCDALQASLVNTILHLSEEYFDLGEIPAAEYQRLYVLYEAAEGVGANGALTAVMNKLEAIMATHGKEHIA